VFKISGSTVPVAVVAVVLFAAIGGSAPVHGADAKDCVGGPKAPSPHGQHWYFRIDRATGHKCWYLRAFLSRPHREAKSPESDLAAAQSTITAAPPLPAPRPAADAATPASHRDSAVRQREIKILNVSTVQFANPPTFQTPQQSTQQPMAAPSVLPASTANENKDPLNTASSTATVDPTADGTDPPNAASGSPNADYAMKPEALATIAPTEIFFLLLLGIGVATFVLGLVIKIVGSHRALPIHEDPDSAWRRYRLDHQRPDLEAANALASCARTALRAAQPNKPVLALTGPFASGLKDLEPALRALREARQHVVA
jgi:hypothetical protein